MSGLSHSETLQPVIILFISTQSNVTKVGKDRLGRYMIEVLIFGGNFHVEFPP